VLRPEEPSPPLAPEREAARLVLNDKEHKTLEWTERDLGRPLTEEEEHLVLDPGPLIEQPANQQRAAMCEPKVNHLQTLEHYCAAGEMDVASSKRSNSRFETS
jgi:hypothetical protein